MSSTNRSGMPASALKFSPELRAHIAANLSEFVRQLVPADQLRHAAVGVVLLPDERGRACFVLTRRVATLRRHSGQWALPGGRLESGESPADAAQRRAGVMMHQQLA